MRLSHAYRSSPVSYNGAAYVGALPGGTDRSRRPRYVTYISAPSWVSRVPRTSIVPVPSGPTVIQSAAATPLCFPESRSPSYTASITSTMIRIPLGVLGSTNGSASVIVAVHNGTSSIVSASVCSRHVDRDQERLPPPAFETSAVARLVLLEDESASLRFVAALDDPRRRVVGRVAEPHRDRRLGLQISYPVRPLAAAR